MTTSEEMEKFSIEMLKNGFNRDIIWMRAVQTVHCSTNLSKQTETGLIKIFDCHFHDLRRYQ